MSGINSGAENEEISATRAACEILSKERNPPMGILINANAVAKGVEILCHVSK
jgi:importin subunit alpha-2